MTAPWSRVRLLSLIPLALLGGGIGFFLSPQAGSLALGLCACFGLLTAWDDWQQKRTAHQLCQELDRLLHGANTANLDAYTEGAWSVLRSQLLKLMTRLQEQADQLSLDKTQLATFLADISHQLRTPLTAMNLLAAQLAQPELPEDKRRQAGRELRQQLERVDWLISALLRMSRLDAHMVELRQDPVDLAQAIPAGRLPSGHCHGGIRAGADHLRAGIHAGRPGLDGGSAQQHSEKLHGTHPARRQNIGTFDGKSPLCADGNLRHRPGTGSRGFAPSV